MFWIHKTTAMKISSVIYTSSNVIYYIGVLEYWSTGVLEWKRAVSDFSLFPTLHHSDTPLLHKAL